MSIKVVHTNILTHCRETFIHRFRFMYTYIFVLGKLLDMENGKFRPIAKQLKKTMFILLIAVAIDSSIM